MDKELVRINEVLAINNDIRDDKNSPEYLIAKQKFDESTECWICKKPLDDDKVWDHNHITGKYRVQLIRIAIYNSEFNDGKHQFQ